MDALDDGDEALVEALADEASSAPDAINLGSV